jgi:hypothetical protein
VDTQTPQLSASATVPGGYPAKPVFWYAFQVVIPGATAGTWLVVQSSGWVAGNSSTWTVPKPLNWGATYYWEAAVSDASVPPSLASTAVTWTTPVSFVVGSAQPAVWNRLGNVTQADDGNPVMTSDLGSGAYKGSGKAVDPKIENPSTFPHTDLGTASRIAEAVIPLTSAIGGSFTQHPRNARPPAIGTGRPSVRHASLRHEAPTETTWSNQHRRWGPNLQKITQMQLSPWHWVR